MFDDYDVATPGGRPQRGAGLLHVFRLPEINNATGISVERECLSHYNCNNGPDGHGLDISLYHRILTNGKQTRRREKKKKKYCRARNAKKKKQPQENRKTREKLLRETALTEHGTGDPVSLQAIRPGVGTRTREPRSQGARKGLNYTRR